jgi:hypothetical protein
MAEHIGPDLIPGLLCVQSVKLHRQGIRSLFPGQILETPLQLQQVILEAVNLFQLHPGSFPIRLDFATPIKEPDHAEKEVFSFTIGYDF